jgi:hypothetical protein
MPLTSGTKLGPYEIQSPLGAGGMGEVYRAKDTRLDRTVAIKILSTHLSDNPEIKQRFEREARAVSALNHPNICQLYEIGSQDGTDFLVMEFLEGETLADRLGNGALPLGEVLKIGVGSGRGAVFCASARDCASRSEAEQHHAYAGGNEAHGLRAGETAERADGASLGRIGTLVYGGADDERAQLAESADHGGQRPRNHPVHVARANRRQTG